jgi:hypothetical protein
MIIHDLDDWGTMTSESAQLMIKKGAPLRRPCSPEARKSGRWGRFVNGKTNLADVHQMSHSMGFSM